MNKVALRSARLVLEWVTGLWEGTSSCYVTKPTRSPQPCIPSGPPNRVPALIGWGKSKNVTFAKWQVTLCDPIWHASSRSSEACLQTAILRLLYFTILTYMVHGLQ